MNELCFPSKFIQWIMQCVQTVTYSIVINGESIIPFNASKVLRQGDPISPYLFVVAMEYLSRSLSTLKDNKSFAYHPRCAKLGVSHLCFTDDLLLFARGDLKSVSTLMECFEIFSQASGLQANMGKSSICFGGISNAEKERIIHHTGLSLGQLPLKYLGILLSTKKLSLIQWIPLVEKIVAKITSWTARKLSYAGRLQLIQAVLFGIQSYWSQLFLIPAKVLKLIESHCRNFLWSGTNSITKKSLVAWERICTPKLVEGMNLINIRLWNKAAISKTTWDLANKQDKL